MWHDSESVYLLTASIRAKWNGTEDGIARQIEELVTLIHTHMHIDEIRKQEHVIPIKRIVHTTITMRVDSRFRL